MKEIADVVAFLANLMTVGASGIAIYLYLFKRKYISTAFNTLVSYSSQLTLSELKDKLDVLNGLHASDDKDRDEIVAVLHEITGQLKGNPKLTPYFADIIERITKATTGKSKLSEPTKRSFVSEIREKIRHAGILNMEQDSGEGK
jgi:hypothetical protein